METSFTVTEFSLRKEGLGNGTISLKVATGDDHVFDIALK